MSIIRATWMLAFALLLAAAPSPGCSTAEYLYVAAWSPSEIHRSCIEADGTLTPVGSQSLAGDVHSLVFNEDRTLAYIGGSNLRTFAVSWVDGSLTQIDELEIGNGSFADLALDGPRLYGTHSAGSALLVFDIGSGVPELIQTRSEPVAPRGLAVLPASNQVLVANGWDFFAAPPGSETIGFFERDSKNGLLAAYGYGAETPSPDRFAVSPSGSIVFYTKNPESTVSSMSVALGIMAGGSTVPVGAGSSRLAIDPAGARLYVANGQDGDISVLQIDGIGLSVPQDCPESTGDCRYPVAGVPVDLAMDRNGRVHVAGAGPLGGTSTVSVFAPAADGVGLLHSLTLPNPFVRRTVVAQLAIGPDVTLTGVARNGSDVRLDWTGASAPYQVFRAEECETLPGQWLMTTAATTATDAGAPLATLSCYRVLGAAP